MMKDFFFKYIHNKYFYTALAFVVWMLFFDSDNLREQLKLSQTIDHLKEQKEYYSKEISKNRAAVNALKYDTTKLEKYAREKYFMKKDNEDVYVVVRDSSDQE
ncbi:MAG: septum formation initiator family protein [Bacteroidales bacterium]|nr:septum formation initiator family protein [Bacteroidales bacterium]